MNRKGNVISFVMLFLIGLTNPVKAQDTLRISIKELFDLVETNSTQLKLSKLAISESEAKTSDLRSSRLPTLDISMSAGYIANAGILGLDSGLPDGWYKVPHFSNSFALQAAVLLYSGGKLNTGIKMSEIQQEISRLNYAKSSQDIKLLLTGYYLDLYTLLQQRDVYKRNIEQSKLLREKIHNRLKAGLVLKSDYVRNDLLVSNYELALLKLDNRIKVINNRLVETLSLPEGTIIVPNKRETELIESYSGNLEELQFQALENHPDNKISKFNIELAEKTKSLVKANRLPTVTLYASNSADRPFVYDLPPVDIYANIFTAGVKVTYNIANLYTNKKKIHLSEIQFSKAKTTEKLIQEYTKEDVYSSYVNYQESIDQMDAVEKEYNLAEENYKRVLNSYNEQISLITDLMDASNNRIAASLQIEQAKTRIIFNYYQLLKSTGNLK